MLTKEEIYLIQEKYYYFRNVVQDFEKTAEIFFEVVDLYNEHREDTVKPNNFFILSNIICLG